MAENLKIITLSDHILDWDPGVVVYVETQFNREMNDFICLHFWELSVEMARLGKTFVYFPLLKNHSWRIRQFVRDRLNIKTLKTDAILNSMYAKAELEQISGPCLIWLSQRENATGNYWCWSLNHENPFTAFTLFLTEIYASQMRNNMLKADRKLYRLRDIYNGKDNENPFGPREVYMLDDVRNKLQCLVDGGVPLTTIRPQIEPVQQLSRLQITEDFRVVLVDYDIEVDIKPISKALFLFYLRHAEGVSLKYLTDYKEELTKLYCQVSGKNPKNPRVWATIERLTDPLDNSVHEKMSRIKDAFYAYRNILDEKVLNQYIISGEQGEKKNIRLARNLVLWNNVVIQTPQ